MTRRYSLPVQLTGTRGTIDLANVLVAVMVIATLTGVITGVSVMVGSWGRDRAVETALELIKSAEARSLIASAYTAGITSPSPAAAGVQTLVVVSNDGRHYVAVAAAPGSQVMFTSDSSVTVTTVHPSVVVDSSATPAAGTYPRSIPTALLGAVWK